MESGGLAFQERNRQPLRDGKDPVVCSHGKTVLSSLLACYCLFQVLKKNVDFTEKSVYSCTTSNKNTLFSHLHLNSCVCFA